MCAINEYSVGMGFLVPALFLSKPWKGSWNCKKRNYNAISYEIL
jgi:hypothetical protein